MVRDMLKNWRGNESGDGEAGIKDDSQIGNLERWLDEGMVCYERASGERICGEADSKFRLRFWYL